MNSTNFGISSCKPSWGRQRIPPEQSVQKIPATELSKANEESNKKQVTGSW